MSLDRPMANIMCQGKIRKEVTYVQIKSNNLSLGRLRLVKYGDLVNVITREYLT
jgi:hypothetical protein